MRLNTTAIFLTIFGCTCTALADNARDLYSTTMPAIDISNQPLAKVFEQLKAKVPSFHFVIYRSPDAPQDYPRLPAMVLEHVSIEQFLKLIGNEYPDVKITEIDNFDPQFSPLLQVDIRRAATTRPAATQPVSVRVFGLAEIISHRASLAKGNGDHEKQASDDILSLIQAALGEMDSPVKPVLKLHPPTGALICRVTSDQAEVIEQVITALRPVHRVKELAAIQLPAPPSTAPVALPKQDPHAVTQPLK